MPLAGIKLGAEEHIARSDIMQVRLSSASKYLVFTKKLRFHHFILVIGAETAPTLVQLEFLGGGGTPPSPPVWFDLHRKHVVAC